MSLLWPEYVLRCIYSKYMYLIKLSRDPIATISNHYVFLTNIITQGVTVE